MLDAVYSLRAMSRKSYFELGVGEAFENVDGGEDLIVHFDNEFKLLCLEITVNLILIS